MIIRPAQRMKNPNNPFVTVKTGQPKSPPPQPPQRIVHHQPPSLASRTTSDYLIHLVPHQSRLAKIPQVSPHQSAVNFRYSSRDRKSNQSLSIGKSFQNAMNMQSTARSNDISQLSQIQQVQRQEYFCPPSPVNLRKIEPVRRISQQKINFSQQSQEANKNPSQQNIHITIETNIPKDTNQPPPKITVSHIQHSPNKSKQHVTVMRNPSNPNIIVHPSPHPPPQTAFILQNNRETSISNQFKTITLPQRREPLPLQINSIPISSQQPVIERKHSLSMDHKLFLRPRSQASNGIIITNGPHQNIDIQQPSCLSEQPVSFSLKNNLPQEGSHHKEPLTVKESELKSSELSKRLKEPNQCSKLTENRQLLREEIYNQYYEQNESQPSLSSIKRQQQRYALLFQQKISSNSRILINEIFENETNKALLKIRSVQNRSRGKSWKKKVF